MQPNAPQIDDATAEAPEPFMTVVASACARAHGNCLTVPPVVHNFPERQNNRPCPETTLAETCYLSFNRFQYKYRTR